MSAHPSLLRAHAHVCVCILIAMFTAAWAPRAGAIPTAPGFVVSVYDSVPDVEDMVFGTDGALYVGRDNSGSGGGNADSVKIHRIVPGGGSHTTWGTRATWDPDAVGFDAAGLVTGVAGSVIVGGRPTGSATGVVSAIRPDQSVVALWGPGAIFVNPTDFVFDGAGRMLMTDFETANVWQSTGGALSVFFSPGSGMRDIAIHPVTGQLYLNQYTSSAIRIYSASGVLQSTLATGISALGMVFGTGGVWGTSLYTGVGTRLIRANSPTSRDTVGSGFGQITAVSFGPDGAMYLNDFIGDKVYRLEPVTAGVGDRASEAGLRLWSVGAQPSRAATVLRFALPRAGRATIQIFDVAGREVNTLFDEAASTGEHEVAWDGRDGHGRGVAPGVYLARLRTEQGVAARRVVRVR